MTVFNSVATRCYVPPLGSSSRRYVQNATIDWTEKESVRAKLRLMLRRTLREYGYSPDKQEKATLTVLEQAELLSKEWAA